MGVGVLVATVIASTATSVGTSLASQAAAQEAADEAAKARGLADHESRVRAMAWQLRSERIGIGSQLEGYGRAMSGIKGGYAGAGGSTGASGKASIKRRVRRNISNIRAQTEKTGIEMGYTRLEFAEEVAGWRQTTQAEREASLMSGDRNVRESAKRGLHGGRSLDWDLHQRAWVPKELQMSSTTNRVFGKEYKPIVGGKEVTGLSPRTTIDPLWQSNNPEISGRGISAETAELLRTTAYGQTKKRSGGFFESTDALYRTGGLGL